MLRVLLLTGIIALVSPLFGQTSSPSAAPSLEQRVADLEAYVTNSARGVDIDSASSSNIAAPGPSYNAWMMTCAALVLFMTLPGLALFYGGLVRAKNVLSVLAPCLRLVGVCGVCFRIAHMVWGIDGWMNGVWNPAARVRAIDFAGGTVVHMTSGWSALVLCILLGHRLGFKKEIMAPHSMVLCMVGTGLLWVGWYGFNAGSALAPDGIAANAFTSTTLATAIASFTWAMLEYALRGKPSVLGFCSGAVAGLVVITPACGYVAPTGAVIIGVAAGIVPFFACTKLKSWLGYDDALDTFGINAVGGRLGSFLHVPHATDDW